MRIPPEPMTGQQIEPEIKKAYAAPKDVIAVAAKLWPPGLPKKRSQKE